MKLGECERPIRTYRVNQYGGGWLLSPKTTVDVTVTNRRVVATTRAQSASQQSESSVQCYVEDTKEMRYGVSNRIRIGWVILGTLLALAGVIVAVTSFLGGDFSVGTFFGGLLILALGVLLIVLGLRKRYRMWLEIFAKQADSMFYMGSGKPMKRIKLGKPSKHILPGMERMLEELPAILTDVLDLGEAACDKWGTADV